MLPKLERWHRSLKTEAIRPNTPLSTEDNQRIVSHYVTHYNTVRLHGAIGYITPKDKLEGRAEPAIPIVYEPKRQLGRYYLIDIKQFYSFDDT